MSDWQLRPSPDELDDFPDFAQICAQRGLPPDEDKWVRLIAWRPESPARDEVIFFLWFDAREATHDEIIQKLRERVRACLESLE